MPIIWLFDIFLAAHIITGATGLITFWVPVIGLKGGENHKKWGRIFARALFVTGISAIGMSLCTLAYPLELHPKIEDAELVRGMFGWMMLYLATLTVSLASYGIAAVEQKRSHTAHRHAGRLGLEAAVLLTAVNCAVQGVLIGQPLMIGISTIGIASAITNAVYIFNDNPEHQGYLKQHVKALVGAGISVYTAFLAFGAARILPQHAFNPILWATPVVLGIGLIIWHQRRISIQSKSRIRFG